MDRAEKLRLYEKLIATNKRAQRKGATMPYTSANGNMFSFLPKTGRVALRLPAAEREAFLKKYRTKLSVQYGAVMKEYVEVPDSLLKKTSEIAKFFALSVTCAHGLQSKPTTRKKKATKGASGKRGGKKKLAKKSAKKTPSRKAAAGSRRKATKGGAPKKRTAKVATAKKAARKKPSRKKATRKKPARKKATRKKPARKKARS